MKARDAGSVRIVDVSPRDGLQNDPADLRPETKIELVERLRAAGAFRVEVGSFVHPERVPKMADTDVVARAVTRRSADRLTALVPNLRGYERAVEAGLRHVRVVVAVSEAMNRANFGMSPADSLAAIEGIVDRAGRDGVRVAGAVATAFGCPYQGRVDQEAVIAVVRRFADLGMDEAVLADTTGMAVPSQVRRVVEQAIRAAEGSPTEIGLHLHNTRNTGYACAFVAYEAGIRLFDASLGGIGGCPFAPKATGNVATEDLASMLERSGADTGMDLEALLTASAWLEGELGHATPGLVAKAGPVAVDVYEGVAR